MHLSHQYNAAYLSGLVQNRCTYHTNTTPLTFLAGYRIDAPNTQIQQRLLFWLGKESMHLSHQYNAAYFSSLVQNRCTYHTNTTPLTSLAWYRIDAPNTPIQHRLLFWLGKELMHLSHQYNAAYFSGLVQNRCTYHTNTTPLTFLAWYRFDAPITPIQRRLLFWLGTESMHLSHQYNAAHFSGLVQNRWIYHTNTTPLTFLAWYRIDAPITPMQRRLHFWLGKESMHLTHQYNAAYFSSLVKNRCTYHTNTTPLTFWLGKESMHLTHQYNAAYFSGLVQNRCTYHTNTTPLTFLAWYRIDAPITPIQRRLHFWLGKESMHLTHQYNAAYFSGLVKNRCTYHTNTTPLTFQAS